MARSIQELQAQYVTDDKGNKTAVILPIEDFEELLEDIEDLASLLERRDETAVSFDEVIAKLKKDGILPD